MPFGVRYWLILERKTTIKQWKAWSLSLVWSKAVVTLDIDIVVMARFRMYKPIKISDHCLYNAGSRWCGWQLHTICFFQCNVCRRHNTHTHPCTKKEIDQTDIDKGVDGCEVPLNPGNVCLPLVIRWGLSGTLFVWYYIYFAVSRFWFHWLVFIISVQIGACCRHLCKVIHVRECFYKPSTVNSMNDLSTGCYSQNLDPDQGCPASQG